MIRYLVVFVALFTLVGEAVAAKKTGLPLPRWVSIKADEANVRTGPGTRYPIQWVFRREGLPVEIVDEFEHWRKIRDREAATGWIHRSMLSGKRMVMVNSSDPQIIRAEPEDGARPIIKVEPTVLGQLIGCQADWCRIQVKKYKGWIRRNSLWGMYAHEQSQ